MNKEITDDELRAICEPGVTNVAFYARVCNELLAARALIKKIPNQSEWREELRAYWKSRGNDK